MTVSYMDDEMNDTINIKGRLVDLSEPQVMGIVNVTPDSFYADSRRQTEAGIAERVNQIVGEGGTMIDVGGCSTRPGSEAVTEAEEMARLRFALDVVRRELPYAIVSVDTFRPDVARMAVEEFGADIINDVGTPSTLHPSPSSLHETPFTKHPSPMLRMVAKLGVPYILMSAKPTLHSVLLDFAERVQLLRDLGQKDIILDPGFGFGKTVDMKPTNYEVLAGIEKLQVLGLPILVGLSRKSMVYKLLGTTPDDALNGTTVLHTIALMKGASILRVHDVRAAVECCRLVKRVYSLVTIKK